MKEPIFASVGSCWVVAFEDDVGVYTVRFEAELVGVCLVTRLKSASVAQRVLR